MSPERRLSKSTRKHVRELKSGLRRDFIPRMAQADSYFWDQTENVLRLTLADYGENFAPHTPILREYCQIRFNALGNPNKLIDDLKSFRQKHAPAILDELKPAFAAIAGIVKKTVI